MRATQADRRYSGACRPTVNCQGSESARQRLPISQCRGSNLSRHHRRCGPSLPVRGPLRRLGGIDSSRIRASICSGRARTSCGCADPNARVGTSRYRPGRRSLAYGFALAQGLRSSASRQQQSPIAASLSPASSTRRQRQPCSPRRAAVRMSTKSVPCSNLSSPALLRPSGPGQTRRSTSSSPTVSWMCWRRRRLPTPPDLRTTSV